MTKTELTAKTDAVVARTTAALQLICDTLNAGQRKKLLKEEAVAALLTHYGVEVSA